MHIENVLNYAKLYTADCVKMCSNYAFAGRTYVFVRSQVHFLTHSSVSYICSWKVHKLFTIFLPNQCYPQSLCLMKVEEKNTGRFLI